MSGWKYWHSRYSDAGKVLVPKGLRRNFSSTTVRAVMKIFDWTMTAIKAGNRSTTFWNTFLHSRFWNNFEIFF